MRIGGQVEVIGFNAAHPLVRIGIRMQGEEEIGLLGIGNGGPLFQGDEYVAVPGKGYPEVAMVMLTVGTSVFIASL